MSINSRKILRTINKIRQQDLETPERKEKAKKKATGKIVFVGDSAFDNLYPVLAKAGCFVVHRGESKKSKPHYYMLPGQEDNLYPPLFKTLDDKDQLDADMVGASEDNLIALSFMQHVKKLVPTVGVCDHTNYGTEAAEVATGIVRNRALNDFYPNNRYHALKENSEDFQGCDGTFLSVMSSDLRALLNVIANKNLADAQKIKICRKMIDKVKEAYLNNVALMHQLSQDARHYLVTQYRPAIQCNLSDIYETMTKLTRIRDSQCLNLEPTPHQDFEHLMSEIYSDIFREIQRNPDKYGDDIVVIDMAASLDPDQHEDYIDQVELSSSGGYKQAKALMTLYSHSSEVKSGHTYRVSDPITLFDEETVGTLDCFASVKGLTTFNNESKELKEHKSVATQSEVPVVEDLKSPLVPPPMTDQQFFRAHKSDLRGGRFLLQDFTDEIEKLAKEIQDETKDIQEEKDIEAMSVETLHKITLYEASQDAANALKNLASNDLNDDDAIRKAILLSKDMLVNRSNTNFSASAEALRNHIDTRLKNKAGNIALAKAVGALAILAGVALLLAGLFCVAMFFSAGASAAVTLPVIAGFAKFITGNLIAKVTFSLIGVIAGGWTVAKGGAVAGLWGNSLKKKLVQEELTHLANVPALVFKG